MGATSPQTIGGSPVSLLIYVKDVDAAFGGEPAMTDRATRYTPNRINAAGHQSLTHSSETPKTVCDKSTPPTATIGGVKAYDKPVALAYTIEQIGAKTEFPMEGVLVHQTIGPDGKTTLEVLEIKQ